MSEDNEVILDSQDIFWNIKPKAHETPHDGIIVDLSWGWTAGFTEEEMKNLAEDAPRGYDSVRITLSQAEELRDELTKIIDKYKNHSSSELITKEV